uniref:ARAD1C10868p n=1 Tax=Blastobotrys adeninivorans TaxID=409370 RepID=A0A060T0T0_BLAAD
MRTRSQKNYSLPNGSSTKRRIAQPDIVNGVQRLEVSPIRRNNATTDLASPAHLQRENRVDQWLNSLPNLMYPGTASTSHSVSSTPSGELEKELQKTTLEVITSYRNEPGQLPSPSPLTEVVSDNTTPHSIAAKDTPATSVDVRVELDFYRPYAPQPDLSPPYNLHPPPPPLPSPAPAREAMLHRRPLPMPPPRYRPIRGGTGYRIPFSPRSTGEYFSQPYKPPGASAFRRDNSRYRYSNAGNYDRNGLIRVTNAGSRHGPPGIDPRFVRERHHFRSTQYGGGIGHRLGHLPTYQHSYHPRQYEPPLENPDYDRHDPLRVLSLDDPVN